MKEDYETVTEWMRNYLNLESRKDLKTNVEAQKLLDKIYREYTQWIRN